MGRQKKNELDAILEQLKKSYATDDVDNIDNSLLEEEETDKDTELASALEKIFASNEIKGEEIIISEDDVQDFISDINITEDNEKSDSLIDEDSLSVVINQENVESVSSIKRWDYFFIINRLLINDNFIIIPFLKFQHCA